MSTWSTESVGFKHDEGTGKAKGLEAEAGDERGTLDEDEYEADG